MAGLEELAKYIAMGDAQKRAIQEDDPYIGGQQIGQTLLGAIASPEANRFDTKDRLIGAALAGILGGTFGGLSDDYQGRAGEAYRGVIDNVLSGRGVDKPDVLSDRLFSDAQDRASIFKIARDLEIQDAQRKFDLDREGKVQDLIADRMGIVIGKDGKPIQLFDPIADAAEKAGRIKKAEVEAEEGGAGPLAGIPKSLRDAAGKELATSIAKDEALRFAREQFQIAKGIPSYAAMIPYSTAGKELDGVSGILRTQVQKILGREMNGPEQEKFLKLLPNSTDSEAQIDLKEKRYTDFIESLTSTPILDKFARSNSKGVADLTPNAESAPSATNILTSESGSSNLVTAPDGNTYVFVD